MQGHLIDNRRRIVTGEEQKHIYYNGQPIDSMSMDELKEALIEMSEAFHDLRRKHDEFIELVGGSKWMNH